MIPPFVYLKVFCENHGDFKPKECCGLVFCGDEEDEDEEDCFKDQTMNDGTWGVRKHRDTINVDKIDILRLQHDIDAEMEEE